MAPTPSDLRSPAWVKAHFFSLLRIIDYETGGVVSYQINEAQRRLYAEMARQENLGLPVRGIVLKARREGLSTGIQMANAKRGFLVPNTTCLTIAHEEDATGELHGMMEMAYDLLPEEVKVPKLSGITGRRLNLANGSRFRTRTAGARGNAGRASGFRRVHCSEVAYWPDAKATLGSIRQTVPEEPGTCVMLESTANGVGDVFHQEWVRASNGESSYVPMFFPWPIFSHYQRSFADDASRRAFEESLSPEECAIQAAHALTLEQLHWRRYTIANAAGGDEAYFAQEYPLTAAEAFLTSGRPFFLSLEHVHAGEPARTLELGGDPVRGGGTVRFLDHPSGFLKVYQMPRPGRSYVVGADVAGNVTLSTHTARAENDGDDYSCAHVLDKESGAQVAVWHGRLDPDMFGVELARLGYLYNKALVAVENQGGYGQTPITALRRLGYPAIYTRQVIDTVSQTWTETYGWGTNTQTRPQMLDNLRAVIRETPHLIRDSGTIGEFRTFVIRRNGTPGGDSGCHDDRVMALAIAHEVRRQRTHRIEVNPNAPVRRKQKRPVFIGDVS